MPKKKSSTISKPEFSYRINQNVIFLEGKLVLSEISIFLNTITTQLLKIDRDHIIIQLDGLTNIDSAGVVALDYLKRKLAKSKKEIRLEGGSRSVSVTMQLFSNHQKQQAEKYVMPGFLENLGHHFYLFFSQNVVDFLYMTADIFYWSIVDLFNSKAHRKGEFYNQAVLIGVNAVFIVGVLAFIIGLVLALQSAAQLREFGANIFIVDLTVIAMMREMGPLISAVLVAGRSGSAIAAEIATMKVTSELDALTTMGLNPLRFVVVPKMHGAVFTLPFLTILANVLGIMGGMTVAYFYLDISPEVFFNRMSEALYFKDIYTGFIKSIIFATVIVLTGSYFGFHVDKGAEGVGKVTTSAVVVAISLVIVADSILGLIFY